MASSLVDSEKLWRECASWLTQCGILRSDHKANWPTADIKDLAYILRDGVLLCNLLNILDPGCIDNKDVNQKPQMAQFLCLRNIQIFLQTCKDSFGLKDTDLFDPPMLFELTAFHRVLCTLSKLSNTTKALRMYNPGFSVQKHSSKEDIYVSLKTVGATWASENPDWMKFSIRCPVRPDELSEEVYEDLCYVTFSPRSPLPEENATIPPVEKRDHVIKELLDTEKNYVDVLKTLKVGFMRPLSIMLRPEALNVIFKDIPELYDIHADFYKQLQTIYTDEKSKLSIIFLNFREKFLIYGSYCANLTDAQAVLQEECDNNDILNQEVKKCQVEANNDKFKLRDILSVPMQRILKYHLLLEKLIEETSRAHEELNALKRAREAMLDVGAYINQVKCDSDQLLVLKKVYDNITDWALPTEYPLHFYGRLIKDGELKIKSHDDQKIHVRYVFIFTKIMVLCKPIRGNQFSFKEYLSLNEFVLEDVIHRGKMNRDVSWSFQWLLVKKNKQTVYTLSARSEQLKQEMIKAIEEALDNIEPQAFKSTSHNLEMHTFEKPTTCIKCSKFLKGLIYQGYKCRICNVAVHKECISTSGRCIAQSLSPHSVHHMDDLIKDQLWFAGEMDRETATTLLERRVPGTYLLRVRPQCDEARYALSLKTNDNVRHMRVFKKRVDDIEQYFLSESRFFKTVLDLVRFYEHTSLRENYERLQENARLLWPYRQLVAEVESDFKPDGAIDQQIALRTGCRVVVLDKHNIDGWYKGRCQNQVGIFPAQCIRVLKEVTTQDCHE